MSALGIAALSWFIWSSPIPQDEDYHNFSDGLSIAGIPNFWNVVSNLPFLIVGLLGIYHFRKEKWLNAQFLIFFAGVSLVAFGSGYYHYAPTNDTLVWDRLPMTVAFTSLISFVISEFIDERKGKLLLIPLLLLGLASIIYWVALGDLRLYALVQFYPILAIPVILVLFRPEGRSTKEFWLLLACYILAKVFETFDYEIHQVIKVMSGHPLKHLAASVGVYLFIKLYTPQEAVTGK